MVIAIATLWLQSVCGKAHDLLIRALPLLPDNRQISAFIIGDGSLRKELEIMIADHLLDKNISVLSYQSGWKGLLKNTGALFSMSRYKGNQCCS